MGLPLLLGFITYISIIFGLTFWLTKYHQRMNCQSQSDSHQGDHHQDRNDESNDNVNKDPTILPSGDLSLPNDKQGGVSGIK